MMFETTALEQHLRTLKVTKEVADQQAKQKLNRIADRHLARIVENTAVGDSPDSPNLRDRWDRSGVIRVNGTFVAEVFNPLPYASYYEHGHKQTPGRLVFIPLRAGAKKYGQTATLHKGRWGIFIRLKKSYVDGKFPMKNSETKAEQELNQAMKEVLEEMRRVIG